jgi:hypothetical protein
MWPRPGLSQVQERFIVEIVVPLIKRFEVEILLPLEEVSSLMLAGLAQVLRPVSWLLGIDRDENSGHANSVPFNKNDGYSPFNALATFALAQGAALTAVAKGEGRDTLVLIIYALIVLATLAWIVGMLRVTSSDPSAVPAAQRSRAYDRPSIIYGRFVLGWTLFLGLILSVLGWLELLPNQTTRVAYNKGAIACDVLDGPERMQRSGGYIGAMDEWIARLDASSQTPIAEHFMWLEQKTPFPESYKPFALDLVCNHSYVFETPVAFLVSQPKDEYRPTYRQLVFRQRQSGEPWSATLDVPDAKKGDVIVVLVFARDPNNKKTHPGKSEYIFRLIPHFDER